jgi:hypothetical protein
MKFTFIAHDEAAWANDNKVTVEFKAIDTSTVVEQFTNFMRGAGFIIRYDEALDYVSTEIPELKDEDFDDDNETFAVTETNEG